MFVGDTNDGDTVGTIPISRDNIERHLRLQGGINFGNRVFLSAVEQFLTKPDIVLDIRPIEDVTPKEASEEYDYIVAAFANIFHLNSNVFFEHYIKWIKQLTIPFFVIGCGIQCKEVQDLDIMKKNIGNSVADFVYAIENSGGKICTRGYITKEFLDMCCKNEAVATGCPSFYRRGAEPIEKKIVEANDFSVAFTSFDYPKKWLRSQMDKYFKSKVVDQQYIISELLRNSSVKKKLDELSTKYGRDLVEYYLNGNVYTPVEVPCWKEELSKFHYSYGSRLHGCSMALYAGIPAKLMCVDLRCKEVADFFGIPSIDKYDSNIDLFEDFNYLDMSVFNEKKKKGYKVFKEFIESNGISHDIDDIQSYEKKIGTLQFEDIEIFSVDDFELAVRYFNSVEYLINTSCFVKYLNKFIRRLRK